MHVNSPMGSRMAGRDTTSPMGPWMSSSCFFVDLAADRNAAARANRLGKHLERLADRCGASKNTTGW